MFLSNPFTGAFGLEIEDLSLTLTQLRRHKPFRKPVYFSVENIRTAALPPGCILNGEIEQPEIVRRKIMHLLGSDKTYKPLRSNWVVANLPELKTFLKRITINIPTADLLPEDVEYHAAKHLPFEMSETYLDWQIITSGNETTDLLLAGVPKTIADSYTYLLEAAGLNVLALEPESIALSRSLITQSKDYTGEARALLHLGPTRSSIVIFDHDMVQFSTSLPFSTEMTITSISQQMKISSSEAADYLFKFGVKHVKEYPKYLPAIDKLVSELVEKIKQTLQFYRDHFDGANPITHITMSGPLADLENLSVILSQKLKISSSPANVWKNVSPIRLPEEKQKRGLSMATAIGLALRAAENPLDDSIL